MSKLFIVSGCFSAAISVILGAFGAHGLRKVLNVESLTVFETGVRYQFYHSFALIIFGLFLSKFNQSNISPWPGFLFVFGIFLFSGSFYLLSCKSLLGIETWKWLGPITPLGGLCFII